MQDAAFERDRHLFSPGGKRILALDGGGVRGALTIAFLERLETILAEIEGRPVRLCEWFDFIGGVSTGAVIAAGLAYGLSATEIRDFYRRLAPRVFSRPWLSLPGWRPHFDARRLKAELSGVFGDMTLGSTDLRTGFGVVMKRMDTGGCWILTNNPRSVFWNTPDDARFIGNAHYRLADIVRASTAAPAYFDPEMIEIVAREEPGVFLDGGLTPHNNPSLAFFLAAVMPPYRLNWPTGPDNLAILSIGTGSYRPKLSAQEARRSSALMLAIKALAAQIDENQELTLMLMSWLGDTSSQWPINSEVGDVGRLKPPFGQLFRYHRCDVRLESDWLARELGVTIGACELATLRQMDNPANVAPLYEYGQMAAERQLSAEVLRGW